MAINTQTAEPTGTEHSKTIEEMIKSSGYTEEEILNAAWDRGYGVEPFNGGLKYTQNVLLRNEYKTVPLPLLPPGTSYFKIKDLGETAAGRVALEIIAGTTQLNGFDEIPAGRKKITVYAANGANTRYRTKFG